MLTVTLALLAIRALIIIPYIIPELASYSTPFFPSFPVAFKVVQVIFVYVCERL